MTGLFLPRPGKRGGPCRRICGHDSCANVRLIAESACSLCGGAIGYMELYLVDSEDVGDGFTRETYTHELCAAKKSLEAPTPQP